MFGGRFSLTRFSLRDTVDIDIACETQFIEKFDAMVSAGKNVSSEENYRERSNADAQLTRGIGASEIYAETSHSNVSLAGIYDMGTAVFTEIMQSEAYIGVNISGEATFVETVSADIFMGKNIAVAETYAEEIKSDVRIGKNISIEENYRESVFAAASAAIPQTESFVITVSVPPGGELRIDSENFTVTLDGEPILHLYDSDKGEFINLDRDTLSLYVSSGSEGEIDGKLIYAERYL